MKLLQMKLYQYSHDILMDLLYHGGHVTKYMRFTETVPQDVKRLHFYPIPARCGQATPKAWLWRDPSYDTGITSSMTSISNLCSR